MAGLYDSGGGHFGGIDCINEHRRPGTKGLTDLSPREVQHLVATHWGLPDLATSGFETIDGQALTYFSDAALREIGVVAKSTRRQIMRDLRDFKQHGIPLVNLPEDEDEEDEDEEDADGTTDVAASLPLSTMSISPRTRTPSPSTGMQTIVNVIGSENAIFDGVYHAQSAAPKDAGKAVVVNDRPILRHSDGHIFYMNRYGQWTLTMWESDIEVNRGSYRSSRDSSGLHMSPDEVQNWELKSDSASANFLDASAGSLVYESMKTKGRWRPAPSAFQVHDLRDMSPSKATRSAKASKTIEVALDKLNVATAEVNLTLPCTPPDGQGGAELCTTNAEPEPPLPPSS